MKIIKNEQKQNVIIQIERNEEALTFFYESKTYELISQGISDMHCLSNYYLADELMIEYRKK